MKDGSSRRAIEVDPIFYRISRDVMDLKSHDISKTCLIACLIYGFIDGFHRISWDLKSHDIYPNNA